MEKDFSIEFIIAPGGLSADIRIVPAEGQVPSLNTEDLLKAIQDEGITSGILMEVVEQMARETILNTWTTVAKGTEPAVGKDGYIEFHFQTERTKARLKEDASGRVNLRDLNLIQNVKKGDILCELMPPETGTSGMTRLGWASFDRRSASVTFANASLRLMNSSGSGRAFPSRM